LKTFSILLQQLIMYSTGCWKITGHLCFVYIKIVGSKKEKLWLSLAMFYMEISH